MPQTNIARLIAEAYGLSDEAAKEIQRKVIKMSDEDMRDPMVQRSAGPDNMPILDTSKGDRGEYNRTTNGWNISGLVERGENVPQHLYQGLSPQEIDQAIRAGGELRERQELFDQGYLKGDKRPAPRDMISTVKPTEIKPIPLAPVPINTEEELLKVRMEKARIYDEFVRKHGYQPGMFNHAEGQPMNQLEGFQLIADQLQARRKAMGDPWAFALGESF